MITASDLTLCSWSCIHFLDEGRARELVVDLTRTRLRRAEVGRTPITSKQELLAQLDKAFEFPGYVAGNWDALDEALSDLEWLNATGYVLIVYNARELWATAPQTAGMLIEIWLTAAERWAQSSTPFHLVFLLERSFAPPRLPL